ncbi:MAG: hypothetical protein QMD85_01240 [Candidatus Aenigmarchaeota archaeon]|nr:hypothetical protein [Candidatus Aenigmarchaeota archaeon]MDI6722172.1 hypothetical protein [Candidatus Aenigmarchaeota archaeon]
MDSILADSADYGNGLESAGMSYYRADGSLLVAEKYRDNELNSVYILYKGNENPGELLVEITYDANGNDRVDGNELAFEMLDTDSNLNTVERVGVRWLDKSYRKRRHGINKSCKQPGNAERFEKAEYLFQRIMKQAGFYESDAKARI